MKKKTRKLQAPDKIIIFVAIGIVLLSALIGILIHEIKWRREWTKDLSKVTIEFTHEDAPESLVVNLGKVSDQENPTLICYNDEWVNADFFEKLELAKKIPKAKIIVDSRTFYSKKTPQDNVKLDGFIRCMSTKIYSDGYGVEVRLYEKKKSDSALYFKKFIVKIKYE